MNKKKAKKAGGTNRVKETGERCCCRCVKGFKGVKETGKGIYIYIYVYEERRGRKWEFGMKDPYRITRGKRISVLPSVWKLAPVRSSVRLHGHILDYASEQTGVPPYSPLPSLPSTYWLGVPTCLSTFLGLARFLQKTDDDATSAHHLTTSTINCVDKRNDPFVLHWLNPTAVLCCFSGARVTILYFQVRGEWKNHSTYYMTTCITPLHVTYISPYNMAESY